MELNNKFENENFCLSTRKKTNPTLDSKVFDLAGSFVKSDDFIDYELTIKFKGKKSEQGVFYKEVKIFDSKTIQ